DGVLLEFRERLAGFGGEIVDTQIRALGMFADVIEAFAVGLPERPAAAEFLMENFAERFLVAIVEPDLRDARALVALAPPAFAFAREEQFLAVGGQRAVGTVIVK